MAMTGKIRGLSWKDRWVKRAFDVVFSMLGLALSWWVILIAHLVATIDTGANGFYRQVRIGQSGRSFQVMKIRTMRPCSLIDTTVTTAHDPRITKIGRFFRKTKIDELPQLINVLVGDMSFVGPRPDVPGFADQLAGDDRLILMVRPGITGPATLAFRDEERLLARQSDPETYNREVIFPQKVRLNREYVENYRFWRDIQYIIATLVGG